MAATSKNKNDWCEVTLTGIDIPFWRLVGFLVKLAVAMIPAAIIISIVFTLIGFLLAALGIGALAAS